MLERKNNIGNYKNKPDPTEKLHLPNFNLIEVIRQEKSTQREDDEMMRTSMVLSSWMITSQDIIKKKTGSTSERKYYLACLNLGTAIMLQKFEGVANKIKDVRDQLNWEENEVIADLANSHSNITLGVDELRNPQKATLQMTKWSNEQLALLAQKIGIQLNSMRRIAMCYALNTVLDQLPSNLHRFITKDIEEFVKKVDWLFDAFNRWIIAGNSKK